MRKGPGFIASRYGSGVRLFLDYAKGYHPWLKESAVDLADVEVRTLAAYDPWDFRRAAGDTLASVNADPRNHFGKHALRRFDR